VARSRETHGSSKIRALDRAAALHTAPNARQFKPVFAAPTFCRPSARPRFPVTRAPWFRAVSPSEPTPDIPLADRLQGPKEFGRAAFGFLRQSGREQIQHRPLRALHFGHRRDRRIVGQCDRLPRQSPQLSGVDSLQRRQADGPDVRVVTASLGKQPSRIEQRGSPEKSSPRRVRQPLMPHTSLRSEKQSLFHLIASERSGSQARIHSRIRSANFQEKSRQVSIHSIGFLERAREQSVSEPHRKGASAGNTHACG
jgi:hypothetical protein